MTLKKLMVGCTLMVMSMNGNAQNVGDTIVVQSFNYNQTSGIGNRDTIINFPELPGVTFEKVLMMYNIRCKDGNVSPGISGQTNIGCGEWDYSCNTYLHDSTRVDSLASATPSHSIGGFSGTAFNYSSQPTHSIYQTETQSVFVNTISSEVQTVVGNTGTTLNNVFATDKQTGKSQYLYTASELLSAGLTAGNIEGLSFQVLSGVETANFVKVKLKTTNNSGQQKVVKN